MASAASILAQAIPCLLNAFPGWKSPVHLHLRAAIGAAGAPTVVSVVDATTGAAATTTGLSIARVSAGVYDVTFPPCRQFALGTLNGAAGSVSAGSFVTADPRVIAYDKSTTNTNAKTGKLRVVFANGTAINTELGNGQEVALSFWADLG
jgi:hypothetical protein